jgi:hypothetical protein
MLPNLNQSKHLRPTPLFSLEIGSTFFESSMRHNDVSNCTQKIAKVWKSSQKKNHVVKNEGKWSHEKS